MVGQLKRILILVAVGIVALTAAYQFGRYQQRQQAAISTAQAISKAIQSRVEVNETIGNMDSFALCLELGGLRDQCEQLRGLATDRD